MNCAVHHERTGNNLCLKCGNWYCDNCINYINGQPICHRCIFNRQDSTKHENPFTAIQNLVLQLPRELRIFFTVIYFILFCVLLGCSVYLMLRYRFFLLYIPTTLYLLGGFVFYFLFVKDKFFGNN